MRILLSLLLILLVNVQTPTYVLDLANADRSTDTEYGAIPENERLYPTPPPAQATHGAAGSPPAPFEVVSLLFDKTSYAFGEEYQCELTLQYVHAMSTTFPVGTQAHLFRRGMPGARAIGIGVVMDQPDTGYQLISTELLYGSDSVIGSLVPLSQGQQIRFQMRGTWRLRRSLPGATWPLQINPKVDIGFADSSVIYAPTLLASSAVLTLVKAQ